jgi:hypothetical protein
MNFKAMAQAALSGPKRTAVEHTAPPVSRRTPFSRDTLRTVAGALFLALSVRTVVRALRAGLRG